MFCIVIALILGNFNFINIAADQEESNVLLEEISCLSEEKKFGNGRLEQSIVCLLSDYKRENDFKSLQTKDLTFVDNKVRLEILLSEEDKLDALRDFDENIEIENHYKSLVQALVPIDIIEQLSEETFVNYIRRPIECQPLATSEGVGFLKKT